MRPVEMLISLVGNKKRHPDDQTMNKVAIFLYHAKNRLRAAVRASLTLPRQPADVLGQRPAFLRSGTGDWAIVGIGININQTRFENLPNPVSLKQITGKNFIIKELVTELAGLLLKNFSRLIKEKEGPAYFLEKYNTPLYKKREVARFRKDNRVFQATIIEVTAAGQLKINHGIDEEIDFGEIEWVI